MDGTLNTYQDLARKFAIYEEAIDKLSHEECKELLRLIYPVLGMCGEAGEIANKVKKLVRGDKQLPNSQDSEINRELTAETGDVLWYTSALTSYLGRTLNAVANQNIDKLQSRANRDKLRGEGDNR